MSQPIAITTVGMVTGVGLNAPANYAAIRCAINNFQETRFMDEGGKWLMGCSVPLEKPWPDKTKLIKMAAMAIHECLEQNPQLNPADTPLILCLSESNHSGRKFKDNHKFFAELEGELNVQFHAKSRIVPLGRVAVGIALKNAAKLIHSGDAKHVIIAGTDSLLVGETIAEFEEREYILTSLNSDGFIPGEAASAIVVEPVYNKPEPQLICHGLGFGVETAHIDSGEPLQAIGLTAAIKAALKDANCEMHDLDFRITDISGQQYYFKEASLALSRTLRQRKKEFDIWHPADCIGETGAATGGIMLGVAKAACEKKFSKGNNILIHAGNNNGKRIAIIVMWQTIGK